MTHDTQVRLLAGVPPEKAARPDKHIHKVRAFVRENPVFLLALVGLTLGTVVRFGLHLPGPANLVWLATLVVGGAPMVYRTVVGMLHGNFATDVVVMLATLVAVIMGQSFAGPIIVIMQSGGEALENTACAAPRRRWGSCWRVPRASPTAGPIQASRKSASSRSGSATPCWCVPAT